MGNPTQNYVTYEDLVGYHPNLKQMEFHSSTALFRLAWGGNGGGKSAALLHEAIHEYALKFPGAACLLIRRNYQELKDGLIKDLLDTVPEKTRQNPSGLYTYNRSDHVATFTNGSTIRFGHCLNNSEKDLAHYLSQAYVFIGFDELGQFSYEAWAFAGTRNRVNAGCKQSAEGEMPIPRMAGATNPTGLGWTWIRDMWGCHLPGATVYAKRPVAQLKFKEPFDATNPDHLARYNPADYFAVYSNVMHNPEFIKRDPGYYKRLLAMPEDLRQKHLYGNPDSKVGSYFQCFDYSRHVKKWDEIKWEPWQHRWMGSDWGLCHAWPTGWFTRAKIETLDSTPSARKYKDVVVLYREVVENELSYEAMAKLVASKTPENEKETLKFLFFSPERFSRDGIDAQHTPSNEWGDHLLQFGLPRPSRASNERVAGAAFIYSMLEAGDLIILDTCPKSIHALQNVQRDPKDLEDVLPMQGPEEYDVYDMIRYGLVSMLMTKGKPLEVKLEEELMAIDDPLARFFYEYKQRAEMKKENAPVTQIVVPSWRKRAKQ